MWSAVILTNLSSRFLSATSALLATAASAEAAVAGAETLGSDAKWVLAGAFVVVGLALRRRVNSGIWASRAQAFSRRSRSLARSGRSGRGSSTRRG